jgi:putative inorganic carbon (hco3(-)) transporter
MAGSLILVILMLSAVVSLRYPAIGFALFFWFDLAAPHTAFWNLFGSIPISQYLGLMALAGCFLSWREKLSFSGFFYVALAYVFWFTLTTQFALEPQVVQFKFDRTIKVFISLVLLSMLCNNRERTELILWIFTLAITTYGVRGGLLTLMGGWGGKYITGAEGGFISDSSSFACALVMNLPILNYLRQHSILFPEAKKFTWLIYIAMGLSLVAIIGSFARTGLIAFAVMLGVAFFFSKRKLMNVVLGVGAIILGFVLAPAEWSTRMKTINTYEEDGSAMGRIDAWKFAIRIANENFFGGGFGIFIQNKTQTTLGFVDSHSWFFESLAEQGYVGAALVSALLIGGWLSSLRIISIGKQLKSSSDVQWIDALGRALCLSQAALIVGGLFIGIASYSYTYLLSLVSFATLLYISNLRKRLKQDRAENLLPPTVFSRIKT